MTFGGQIEKSIKDIAERVARIYNVNASELLKKKSKYTDARNLVIELSYISTMYVKSLTEIGREVGGISGSAVGYVHSRVKKKLREKPEFKRVFIEAGEGLSILET